jgi:hypothetical protein
VKVLDVCSRKGHIIQDAGYDGSLCYAKWQLGCTLVTDHGRSGRIVVAEDQEASLWLTDGWFGSNGYSGG